jgi:hypothetical protein
MQLVAYGAQDIYLTGNPQITFFKVVYRRHTNFAMESIEQGFNGNGDFGKKVTCTISRNGDLIHRTYLRVVLPNVTVPANSGFRWVDWVGHALVKSVELEIGGQRIDKHYGDWLHIWSELTQTAGHIIGYSNMVGNTPRLTTLTRNNGTDAMVVKGETLYIPLEFFYCSNPGLALPLIALQYHEVKINVDFNEARALYYCEKSTTVGGVTTWSQDWNAVQTPTLSAAALFVDFIFLDTDERRRFAQVSHEYLISQLQHTGDESTSSSTNKIKMNFNHPTKEVIWVVQPDDNVSDTTPFGKQWFNYTDAVDTTADPNSSLGGGIQPGVAAGGANNVYINTYFDGGANPVDTARIQLNGHDRTADRDGRYYNLVQPYQHHENIPSKGINLYSFGLRPEEHQPSGTCNFSRIDNAILHLTLTNATVKGMVNGMPNGAPKNAKVRIYAVNYNVLRIMSGMGGLAYSN